VELVEDPSEGGNRTSSQSPVFSVNLSSSPSDNRVMVVEAAAEGRAEDLTVPQNSTSLSQWEKKVRDFEKKQASRTLRNPQLASVVTPGPSPVSSRTRTSLKRSSSFSHEDDQPARRNFAQDDRTSVSLRKVLEKRKCKEAPQTKRGKRDVESL
jgi:hypothetical protein